MPDFLLTVAVPTFDRAPLLAQTLASIADACRETTEPVEVLVVDNASADNTRDVVAGFAGAIPALRYECQHANVGGEANFFSCIDRARGRHVWVVGDDDVVERNAVVSILSALHGGAGAVVVNYSVYASDLQTVIKPRLFTEPRDRVFEVADQVLERFGAALGFTAAVVVNRERVLGAGRDAFMRHAGVGLAFLDSAYRSLVGASVAYLAEPLVRNRGANSRDLSTGAVGWSSESWDRVFVGGMQQVLAGLSAHGYSRRAVRRARNLSIRMYVPERLRFLRRTRRSWQATVRALMQHAYTVPSVWTRALPMLLIPRSILQVTPALRRRRHRRRSNP